MPARQRKRVAATDDESTSEQVDRAEADEEYDEDTEDEPEEELEEKPKPKPERRKAQPSQEINATEAARIGVREVSDLTSKQALGVTLIERSENGWLVGVEVLEDSRIPSAADVLAEYEAEIDMAGSLLFVRRTQRYQRGRGNSNGR